MELRSRIRKQPIDEATRLPIDSANEYLPIPRYQVNLAAPPWNRWTQMAHHCRPLIPPILRSVESAYVPDLKLVRLGYFVLVTAIGFLAACGALLCWLSHWCWPTNTLTFFSEVWSFARAADVHPGKLLLMQFVYEASTACTSIIIPTAQPIHLRTMEWQMPFDLRPMTAKVEFVRDGAVVCSGTTWCGYMGMLTAQRHGGFSVSVNYRHTESSTAAGSPNDQDLDPRLDPSTVSRLIWAMAKGHWNVGSLVRAVCTDEQHFAAAVARLNRAPLLAPCYLIVCGVQPGEGIGITRTCTTALHPQQVNGLVIQGNCDWWEANIVDNIMDSSQRCEFAAKEVKSLLNEWPSGSTSLDDEQFFKRCWKLLSDEPIRSEACVYANVMCPATGAYDTRCQRLLPVAGPKGFRLTKYKQPTSLIGNVL